MTIEAWIKENYTEGSEPGIEKVMRWIENGNLASVKEENQIMIPEDAMYVSDIPRSSEVDIAYDRTTRVAYNRSTRLVQNGVPWYFLTRGGDSTGPFETVEDAKQALHDFVSEIRGKK